MTPGLAVAVERPFRGLRYFDEEDAHLFFGRDEQVDDLLTTLRRSRFVAVTGSSGSGKSSLVRAGLVPALRAGFFVEAGGDWRVVIVRPGNAPIANLAAGLQASLGLQDAEITLRRGPLGLLEAVHQAQLSAGQHLLLIVDQFEELFRFQRESASRRAAAEESAAVVKLLLEPTSTDILPIYVVLTLRSDFLGSCAQFRDLPERLNDGLYIVPRPRRDQIQQAITGPLGVVGVEIAPCLVQRLLNDVGDDPDQLPVLQHALLRTWQRWFDSRLGGALDLPHYEATGALERSLSDHATEIYQRLEPRQQAVARVLFQRLIDRDAENREVRRRATIGEVARVAHATPAEVSAVVDAFAADGVWLLMRQGDLVDITHESLIRKWALIQGTPDRKGWLQEEIDARDVFLELEVRARRRTSDRDLLQGTDLERAVAWRSLQLDWAWASRYAGDEEAFERAIALVDDSRQKVEREERAAAEAARRAAELRERQRRRAYLVAALAILVAIGVSVLAFFVWRFKTRADAQARTLRASTIVYGAAAVLPRDPTVAALVLNEAPVENAPWIATQVANDTALQPVSSAVLQGPAAAGPVTALAVSRDGQRVVGGFADGSVRIWRSDGRDPALVLSGHTATITDVSISDTGQIASGAFDGSVRIWDNGGAPAATIEPSGAWVHALRLSSDGSRMLVAGAAGRFEIFNIIGKTLAPAGAPPAAALAQSRLLHGPYVVSPLAGINGLLWCWDGTCEPRQFHRHGHLRVLSGNGRRFLSTRPATGAERPAFALAVDAGNEPVALYLEPVDGTSRPLLLTIAAPETLAAINHDGTAVAVATSRRVFVWFESGPPAEYASGSSRVQSVQFHPDGRRVLARLEDGSAQLLGEDATLTFRGHRGAIGAAFFTLDGSHLVTASDDGAVRIWPAQPTQPAGLHRLRQPVRFAAFHPDGRRLVLLGSDGGSPALWTPGASNPDVTFDAGGARIEAIGLSPHGKLLLARTSTDTLLLWSTDDPRRVVLTGEDPVPVREAAPPGRLHASFSPDSTRVIAGDRGGARIWKVDERSLQQARGGTGDAPRLPAAVALTQRSGARRAIFSPAGDLVATAGGQGDNVARLFRNAGGTPLRAFQAHPDAIEDLAFSPDGARLATASVDGTVRLWAVSGSEEPIELRGHTGSVRSVSFSPKGERVITGSADATARIWKSDGSDRTAPIVLIGHSGPLTRAVFHPRDPTRVLTASADGTIRVWDATGRGEIVTFRAAGPVNWADFSPDGARVVGVPEFGPPGIWLATLPALLDSLRGVTTSCLTAPERRRFVGETADEASAGYQACERRYGRLGQAPK